MQNQSLLLSGGATASSLPQICAIWCFHSSVVKRTQMFGDKTLYRWVVRSDLHF